MYILLSSLSSKSVGKELLVMLVPWCWMLSTNFIFTPLHLIAFCLTWWAQVHSKSLLVRVTSHHIGPGDFFGRPGCELKEYF